MKLNKEEKYKECVKAIRSLVKGEKDLIANMANTAAELHISHRFWWTGFYRVVGNELILGPFQGPTACTHIAYGKGVCGTAWKERRTLIVPNVEDFPGHIACSSMSRSEIVTPLFNKEGLVFGVLDIDSEYLNNFDETDQYYLEMIASFLTV